MSATRIRFHISVLAGIVLALLVGAGPTAVAQSWKHYGGDIGGSRFSALTSIDRDNVAELERVWTYRTGAVAENPKLKMFIDFQATPILLPEEAGGHLIVCTPFTKVIALDPDHRGGTLGLRTEVQEDTLRGAFQMSRTVAVARSESRGAGALCDAPVPAAARPAICWRSTRATANCARTSARMAWWMCDR